MPNYSNNLNYPFHPNNAKNPNNPTNLNKSNNPNNPKVRGGVVLAHTFCKLPFLQ